MWKMQSRPAVSHMLFSTTRGYKETSSWRCSGEITQQGLVKHEILESPQCTNKSWLQARGGKKRFYLSLLACVLFGWCLSLTVRVTFSVKRGQMEEWEGWWDCRMSCHTHLRCQMSHCDDCTSDKHRHLSNGCQNRLQYDIYSHCFSHVQSVENLQISLVPIWKHYGVF